MEFGVPPFRQTDEHNCVYIYIHTCMYVCVCIYIYNSYPNMRLFFWSKESLGLVLQRGCVLIQDLPSLEDGWSVCTIDTMWSTTSPIRTQLPHVLLQFLTDKPPNFWDHVESIVRTPGKKHLHISWLVQGHLNELLYRLRQHRVRRDQRAKWFCVSRPWWLPATGKDRI